MKTVIIIHGMPSREEYGETGSHSSKQHWLPWMKSELEAQGISTETPEMPEPYAPNYREWKMVFEQLPIDEETVLIGHSCGGGFLVRWLSENKKKVGAVMLVAPWMDPDNSSKEQVGDFFSFTIDAELSDRTDGVTIFYSKDDDIDIVDTVALLEKTLKNFHTKTFEDKGHFTSEDMGTIEFPELLSEVLK